MQTTVPAIDNPHSPQHWTMERALVFAASWQVAKLPDGQLRYQPQYPDEMRSVSFYTAEQFEEANPRLAAWVAENMAVRNTFVFTDSQIEALGLFLDNSTAAVPRSAVHKTSPDDGITYRLVRGTLIGHAHGLTLTDGAWFKSYYDVHGNLQVSDIKDGHVDIDSAWLEKEHPGWCDRLALARTMEVDAATSLSMVFGLGTFSASKDKNNHMAHQLGAAQLPESTLYEGDTPC